MNARHLRHFSLAAATALSLLSLTAQAATLTNGDFEDGLSLWSVIGDAEATNSFGIGAVSGASALLLSTASADLGAYDDPLPWSGHSAVDNYAGALNTFTGAAPGALDLSPGFEAYTGSAATQTFTVQAGQTLSFQWNLLTRDAGMPDYGFVVVNGSVMQLAGSSSAVLGTPLADLPVQTGWQTYNRTFSQNTTVTLALGVVSVGDSVGTTALLVDKVQVTAVPEPESVSLLLAGLFALGVAVKRRT